MIVAAGPSARDANLALASGRANVLAINESWRLAPWADVLYGADAAWWVRSDGLPQFDGLKITQDLKAAARFPSVRLIELRHEHRIITQPGIIGSGGNGGFQALNLAVQFGARRIALVGFDMTLANGSHWHGRHPVGLNNPGASTIACWRRRLDEVAPQLARLGVHVVNCSAASALAAYRKMSLEEALTC